jgi:hypothetical protein
MVDKNLYINQSGSFSNTFRPLILQNGRYYMAGIPGPSFSGGSTGFITLSKSGLLAGDFKEYDFNTGQFLSSNPDFAGTAMSFGIGQISFHGDSNTTITAIYDNLVIEVEAADTPGDFNGDCNVDAADYVVWRNGLGTTYTSADFDTWRTHFGQGNVATGTSLGNKIESAVPEPATFGFAVFMLVLFPCYGRGRTNRC